MKVFLFLLFTFFLDITFNLYININLLYPMFTLSSLIILYFLIKNKNNYNKEDTHKKKNIPYRSDRYDDDFNWDSLYANYKEISATSNV